MLVSHRGSDAVIAVYQDNDKAQIIIHDVNDVAEETLGYSKDELVGQSIASLLPTRIYELLDEYVEYENYGNDVGSVLAKTSGFCVVNKEKKELEFQVKVQRTTPVGNHDQFTLILQAYQNNRRTEAFRSLLKENFKGHEVLDQATGLPDRASLVKDIEFVLFYVHKKELIASMSIIELDDMDKHKEAFGEQGVADIMKHIASLCRQNLRGDDVVGLVSPGRIGLVLFDASDDAAKMVLNRMRWLIAANGCEIDGTSELASLSVRVAYSTLGDATTNPEKIMKNLETSLDDGSVSANRVHQTSSV